MGAAGTLQDTDDERTRECAAERRIRRQSDSGSRSGQGDGASDVRRAGADGGPVAAYGRPWIITGIFHESDAIPIPSRWRPGVAACPPSQARSPTPTAAPQTHRNIVA